MKFYGCKFYDYKICLIKDTSIVLWHNDGIDNLRREFVKNISLSTLFEDFCIEKNIYF